MKLTREKVSQLSDVELNRAMIWYYPPKDSVIYNGAIDMYLSRYRSLDYLNSYDLTMPLAFSSGIGIKPPSYMNPVYTVYQDYIIPDVGCRSRSAYNINPLRAICEVLLMIAMEREE